MAVPAQNLLSEALLGKPADQSQSVQTVEPVSPMPTAPLEAVMPSTSEAAPLSPPPVAEVTPALEPTPTPTLEPTPISLESQPPSLEPVTPTADVSPTVSQEPVLPSTDKKGPPLGAIGAAVAVIAVVVFGAGAAVVLTQQPQDIRQQAFMGTPVPMVAPGNPDELIVLPTMENSFNSFMQIYPNANSRTLVAGGVVGQLFTATAPEGNQIYFAKFAGLQDSAQSIPMAWFVYDDGTFVLVGTIEMVDTEEGQRGHIVYQEVLESAPQRFIISYEAPLTEELTEYSFPSQRVIDVAL